MEFSAQLTLEGAAFISAFPPPHIPSDHVGGSRTQDAWERRKYFSRKINFSEKMYPPVSHVKILLLDEDEPSCHAATPFGSEGTVAPEKISYGNVIAGKDA